MIMFSSFRKYPFIGRIKVSINENTSRADIIGPRLCYDYGYLEYLYVPTSKLSKSIEKASEKASEIDPWNDAYITVIWDNKSCLVPESKLKKDNLFNRAPFRFNTVQVKHLVSKESFRVLKSDLSCR